MSRLMQVLFVSLLFVMGGLSTSCGGDEDAAKKGKKGKKAKKNKKNKKAKKGKLGKAGKLKKGKKAGKGGKATAAIGCKICQPCSSSPDCGSGEYCKKGFDEVSGSNYAYCTMACNPKGPNTCPGGSKCAPSGICSQAEVGGICEVAVPGCTGGKKGGKKGK